VNEATPETIDARLLRWRQGDFVLAEHWFVFRTSRSSPQTDAGRVAAEAESDLAEVSVRGFVLVTQTCDIVRGCCDRPFVEVSPLVEVSKDDLQAIERGRRPQYAYVPGVAEKRLVADLDRTMTVEKAVVAEWERRHGCTSDDQARWFSEALARKRQRAAFPDDFVAFVGKLQRRLVDKHGKESDEGAALRALREIRVLATPDWSTTPCSLVLYFIRDESASDFAGTSWAVHLEKWMKLVPKEGRFSADGQVTTLARMNASDYVHSDRLDLDHLSKPVTKPPPT
jgi:hypothetical protein